MCIMLGKRGYMEREKNIENDNMNTSAQTEGQKQNIMGYMPCNKLLLTLSLPMMLSMMVQALYNIVDSIFVAQLNENALTAVSLAFPIQSFLIAVGAGTGVGINARLSRKLGEKNQEEVNVTAGNAILIAIIYAIIFAVLGQFICGPFYKAMTADAEIRQYGVDYIYVVLSFGFALIFQMTGERLLQSTGKTIYSMITQGAGAIFNIIMDPILIFGLLGFPAMGTKGAAIATVAGQCIAAILAIIFNLKVNKEINFDKKYLKPESETIKAIYAVGLPSIVMQSISSVMNFGMNKILLQFSSTAAAAFGIYFKLQSFVFMPIFGMNNGVVPIIAFNFGARKPDRIKETFKLAVMYATGIMVCGMLIFEFLPGPLLRLFNASDNLYSIGTLALRIIAVHFIFAGYDIICSSMFQALGHGLKSLWVSLVRQLIVLLPAAFILAKLFGLNAVWLSFPIAELASLLLSTVFIRHIFKAEIEPLYNK